MKYYHVIYTSSQRLMSGGNGFGIRTATEGTPQEYLQTVINCVTANKLNSKVDTCDKMPTATALLADGTTIREVPPRYFYLQETVGAGPLYILGRNVYLGFTEPFYFRRPDGKISGKSCRGGNFLIDLYLFEERPPRQVFQMLYEYPEEGRSLFVPEDAAPSVNNEQMAALATGDPQPLPVEAWPVAGGHEGEEPFLSRSADEQDKAVSLLFAIIEARLEGKKLVVRCPWKETARLLANVMHLLHEETVGTFTFSTNYSGNGYNVPAEVNFCNEYYKVQYVGKDLFVDLSAAPLKTRESDAYRQIITDAISNSDMETVRDLADWMLSAPYKDVRNLKPHTNKTLFVYTQQPENFTLSMLHAEAKDDAELLSALGKVVSDHPDRNGQLFARLLRQQLADAVQAADAAVQTAKAVEAVETYRRYIPLTQKVADDFLPQIEDALMSNPLTAIRQTGVKMVRQYTADLAQGISREELAPYFFDMVKEHLPQTLADAHQTISRYAGNAAVQRLLAQHFCEVFASVYESVVRDAAARRDKAETARQLDLVLLDPMKDAASDALYRKFETLYDVLSDTARVDTAGQRELLALLQRLGMVRSKTGDALRQALLSDHRPQAAAGHVRTLCEVWHMDALSIIKAVNDTAARDKSFEASRKAYVSAAIQGSGLTLQQVMDVLDKSGFTAMEADRLLTDSREYRSAYRSYRWKRAFSSIIAKIRNLFK